MTLENQFRGKSSLLRWMRKQELNICFYYGNGDNLIFLIRVLITEFPFHIPYSQ